MHESRPYKKLSPVVVALHRERTDGFLKRFWEYYDLLLAYRQKPTPEEHSQSEAEFDRLFTIHTRDEKLDKRIAKTRAKRESLL